MRYYQLEFEALRRVIPDCLPWPLRPDPITDDQFDPLIAYLKKIRSDFGNGSASFEVRV